MKYAFVFGTSAFIVPQGIISYADEDRSKDILYIRTIYHDNEPDSFLSLDLDISDAQGNYIRLTRNTAESEGSYKVKTERDSVQVFNSDGSTLIHIHQLDDVTAMGLEHNITAELELQTSIVVIRINGDFMTEGIHVIAENEKLFVNDDAWATSAQYGHQNLRFTPAGVVL